MSLPVSCRMAQEGEGMKGNFNGCIDEVEIYDRALTASEIQAIFKAGSRRAKVQRVVEAATGERNLHRARTSGIYSILCGCPLCLSVAALAP